MTETPKLQATGVCTNLDTIFAGVEKLTVFRSRWDLGQIRPEVSHAARVGVEDAAVVNATVSLLFEPGVLAVTQLTQVFLEFQDP